MTIVDALKNLAVAIKGSGTPADVTGNDIAEVIQYIATNWPANESGGGD